MLVNNKFINIYSPQNQLAPVAFGVEELIKTITSTGIKVEMISELTLDKNRVDIYIGLIGDKLAGEYLKTFSMSVPEKQESYILGVRLEQQDKTPTIVIIGSDQTGAMYGALDAAEQIGWMEGKLNLFSIKSRTCSPFLSLRGTNPFIHRQAIEDEGSWFHDDEFWMQYLDQLARTRHNFLDIHACNDLLNALCMPNIFLYLFKFKEYPNVGVPEKEARRNLDRLKKVVAMAKERGIKVGLLQYYAPMYNLSPPVDITKPMPLLTGAASIQGSFYQGSSSILDTDEELLIDYTAKCVKTLLQEIPELEFVGFRIAESGRGIDFYRESYLKGFNESGNTKTNIYARSWAPKPVRKDLEGIAQEYPGKVYVTIKYNGEVMVMPYIIAGGWMEKMTCYSYQNFSNLPHGMVKIIWHIRASGTTRFFPWGDPEFIKRTLENCTFLEGEGYSVEPPSANYPLTDFFTNTNYYDNTFFRWLNERDWVWHEMWGRLGYDPETPEQVWVEKFKHRFGKSAGQYVYNMFVQSCRFVPLFNRMRQFQPDHNWYLPEIEAAFEPEAINTRISNSCTCSNEDSCYIDGRSDEGKACEVNSYVGIFEYTDNILLGGQLDGRIHPYEVFSELEEIHNECMRNEETARDAEPKSIKEFNYYARNAEILWVLSKYHIHKMKADIAKRMSLKTRAVYYVRQFEEEVDAYVKAWEELAVLTTKSFRPFLNSLCVCKNLGLQGIKMEEYHWRDELPKLKERQRCAKMFAAEFRDRVAKAAGPVLAIVPAEEPKANDPVVIRCNIFGGASAKAKVHYRTYGSAQFKELPMEGTDQPDMMEASICPDILPGKAGILEYYVENGLTVLPKGAPEGLYRVRYGEVKNLPKVEINPVKIDKENGKVLISATITDPYGIVFAKVRYKRMPSDMPWISENMEQDKKGVYSKEVPMTWHGIQYCIEAVSASGRGIVVPDVRKDRPYINVEGWAKVRKKRLKGQ